jgi:light-regulated signal transduction histidine kinase (bacteriophytochrome)
MKDKRFQQIKEQIIRYANGDYDAQTPVSPDGDELDAIIAGLNALGEEYKTTLAYYRERTERINQIMELILDYSSMDFSKKAKISQKGDEVDAIAAGLNALGEEFTALLAAERESSEAVKEYAAQLEFSNKELDAFTYSVSHDLRSPLRAINGFAKLLSEEYEKKIGEEGHRIINIIVSEAARMGNLIDDLLALSRLSKRGLNKKTVDMNEVVEDALEALADSIGNAKVIVNKLSKINGDKSLLKQVFINLLSNSLKFSKPRLDPVIEVGSYREGKETVFYVRDNGVGFNMQYAGQLFGTFHRLHSQEDFEGTGIGLSIVKRVIEHHDGKVWAEAKENKGATFYFSIPDN